MNTTTNNIFKGNKFKATGFNKHTFTEREFGTEYLHHCQHCGRPMFGDPDYEALLDCYCDDIANLLYITCQHCLDKLYCIEDTDVPYLNQAITYDTAPLDPNNLPF